LLEELGRRRMTNVLVEEARACSAVFSTRAVDEVHVFVAPRLAGGGGAKTPVGGRGVERIGQAVPLAGWHVESLEGDVYLRGWRPELPHKPARIPPRRSSASRLSPLSRSITIQPSYSAASSVATNCIQSMSP
jgi:hypothetical protein